MLPTLNQPSRRKVRPVRRLQRAHVTRIVGIALLASLIEKKVN
jgi:hypothetical protein